MKTNILKTSLLALVAMTFVGASAQAQTIVNGDLVLGFRKSGSTQDFVVNVGSINSFDNLNGSSFTIDMNGANVGSGGSDLLGGLGSAFNTVDNSINWSVAGTTGPTAKTYGATTYGANTIWLTRAASSNTPGVQTSTAWDRSTSQSSPRTAITSMTTGFSTITTAPVAGFNGGLQLAADGNSYDTRYGVSPSAAFSSGLGESSAAINIGLDLYSIEQGTGSGVFLGTFNFNSGTGDITFTAVPEPSTYALIGLGLGGLMLLRRYNTNSKKA